MLCDHHILLLLSFYRICHFLWRTSGVCWGWWCCSLAVALHSPSSSSDIRFWRSKMSSCYYAAFQVIMNKIFIEAFIKMSLWCSLALGWILISYFEFSLNDLCIGELITNVFSLHKFLTICLKHWCKSKVCLHRNCFYLLRCKQVVPSSCSPCRLSAGTFIHQASSLAEEWESPNYLCK